MGGRGGKRLTIISMAELPYGTPDSLLLSYFFFFFFAILHGQVVCELLHVGLTDLFLLDGTTEEDSKNGARSN